MNNTGGSETHKLSIDNLPKHYHYLVGKIQLPLLGDISSEEYIAWRADINDHGDSLPHSNKEYDL